MAAGEGNGAAPDAIDAAIAESQRPRLAMERITVTISGTGRPINIEYPLDLTDSELIEFVGWVAVNLRIHIAQLKAQNPASRIIVPGRPG